jgi:hypothetical protein
MQDGRGGTTAAALNESQAVEIDFAEIYRP